MQPIDISLDTIRVSPLNTRKDLKAGTEDTSLRDLAESIREHGLLSPVIVMTKPGGGYELIAGQRRFRACQQLGKQTIPAIVRDDLDPTDATIISLIENVHRADMSPIDKAHAYQSLYDRYQTYYRVSEATGVSPSTIRRYLHLLNLAPAIQQSVSTGEGPAGVGTLSNLAKTFDPQDQEAVLGKIGGFGQRIQSEIIKRSHGEMSSLDELRRQALEGAFSARTCSEGLCFAMSEELKEQVKRQL